MINEYKYKQYLSLFKDSFPKNDIKDKVYDVTLVRHLMMYFLYLDKYSEFKTNYNDIAKKFNCGKATVCIAINNIKQYRSIKNVKSLNKYKTLYKYFFVQYNRIHKNKTKK